MWYDGNNAIEEIGVNFVPDEYDFNKEDTNSFIENVKKRDVLPFDKLSICYSDNLWDFSGYRKQNKSISWYRFDFAKVPICFRESLKNYVLINIIEGRKKINVINSEFDVLQKFMNYVNDNGVTSIEKILIANIKNWVNIYSTNQSERYKRAKVLAIKNFCECYDANFKQIFSKDFYNELISITDRRLICAESENSKTPDIPSEVFSKIISSAITTIDDEEAPLYYRALSCMLLMESQVGLRTGELFNLRIGCVKEIRVSSGDHAYYVEYETWKRHHGIQKSSREISYVNSHFKKGYDTIVRLSSAKREELGSDCLFVESKFGKRKKFPLDPGQVTAYLNDLFAYYNKYYKTIYDTFPDISDLSVSEIYINKIKKYVVRPTITQFRVHVCTELYAKGCPIEYIEKFMSHLSTNMAYYYVRPQKSVQENIEESTKILRDIVTKDSIPIGLDKGLIKKIDEFIEKNHMSIEKDLDAICAKLAEHIPIRIKTGGVCIKSSKFRECSKDALTNEFYCAYGVCPNIYTFYYMADISYSQIKDLCEAIEVNRARGCMKQVQKNSLMLHSMLQNKLIPQINELKHVIEEKGLDYILNKYPQITSIVVNLDNVEKDIDTWKKMIAYDKN